MERHFIEINGVAKNYGDEESVVQALRHIDLCIEDGEFLCVMGQSGCGKSTLLSVIGGLNHPTHGSLFVDTLDVYDLSAEQRADFRIEYIGIIFQSFQLIPYLTVRENVMLPMAAKGIEKREQSRMAHAALNRVGLNTKEDRLPDQLSGGEQERVAIARAIINDPPILLADEPTGNLDSETESEIMELFATLSKDGRTVIMVTHNPDLCRYAERTIFMKDGRIDGSRPNN